MRWVSDLHLQKIALLSHVLVPVSRHLKLGIGKTVTAAHLAFFYIYK